MSEEDKKNLNVGPDQVHAIKSRIEDSDARFFVITDSERSGAVVGFSKWHPPGHFKAGKEAIPTPSGSATKTQDEVVPELESSELYKEFSKKVVAMRTKVWGENAEYWCNCNKSSTTSMIHI